MHPIHKAKFRYSKMWLFQAHEPITPTLEKMTRCPLYDKDHGWHFGYCKSDDMCCDKPDDYTFFGYGDCRQLLAHKKSTKNLSGFIAIGLAIAAYVHDAWLEHKEKHKNDQKDIDGDNNPMQ